MALPLRPIAPFLLDTKPAAIDPVAPRATILANRERIINFARHLADKKPPLPAGIIFKTIVWIKDVFHRINLFFYSTYYRHSIADARARIGHLLGLEFKEENYKAIFDLARPFSKMLPDLAFYQIFAGKSLEEGRPEVELEMDALRLLWEKRGYVLSDYKPLTNAGGFLKRPLIEEFAEAMLFQAPFLTKEERLASVSIFFNLIEKSIHPENMLKYVNLLGQVLPRVLYEGLSSKDPLMNRIEELKELALKEFGAIDEHPIYQAFSDKLTLTTSLPLIAQNEGLSPADTGEVGDIIFRSALTFDHSLTRDVLSSLENEIYADVPFRNIVLNALRNDDKDPQVLIRHLLAVLPPGKNNVKNKISELLNLQNRQALGAAFEYGKNKLAKLKERDIRGVDFPFTHWFPDGERLLAAEIHQSTDYVAISFACFSGLEGEVKSRIGKPILISHEELRFILHSKTPFENPLINKVLFEIILARLSAEDHEITALLVERERTQYDLWLSQNVENFSPGDALRDILKEHRELSRILGWAWLYPERRVRLEQVWQEVLAALFNKMRLKWAELDLPHHPLDEELNRLEQMDIVQIYKAADDLLSAVREKDNPQPKKGGKGKERPKEVPLKIYN
jgi:hypothetical protein